MYWIRLTKFCLHERKILTRTVYIDNGLRLEQLIKIYDKPLDLIDILSFLSIHTEH